MRLYLDADIFLTLLKEEDRFKKSAKKFLNENKENKLITSSITCLEIWFFLYKNNLKEKAFDAVRSIKKIAEVIEFETKDMESALLIAEKYKLTPADLIHAILAKTCDAIVSSDKSFLKINELKIIDFSKE